MVVGIGKFCHKCYGRHYIGIFFLALLCFYRGKIGIFCEMTKYGFTSINGDFIFARNAKSAFVDNCLLEDII